MKNDNLYKKQYDQAGYFFGQDFGQVPKGRAGGNVSDQFKQPQISVMKSLTSGPRTSAGGQRSLISVCCAVNFFSDNCGTIVRKANLI